MDLSRYADPISRWPTYTSASLQKQKGNLETKAMSRLRPFNGAYCLRLATYFPGHHLTMGYPDVVDIIWLTRFNSEPPLQCDYE